MDRDRFAYIVMVLNTAQKYYGLGLTFDEACRMFDSFERTQISFPAESSEFYDHLDEHPLALAMCRNIVLTLKKTKEQKEADIQAMDRLMRDPSTLYQQELIKSGTMPAVSDIKFV